DTLFGASYMALAPEHPLVQEIGESNNEVKSYLEKVRLQGVSEEALEKMEKIGVPLGIEAINPINGLKIPVWSANFVLMTYGTGAIMSVPAHDDRDFEFAKNYNLPIIPVIYPDKEVNEHDFNQEAFCTEGLLMNSGKYDGMNSERAKTLIASELEKKQAGKKVINYRLRDWLISRQRYWGAPIPVLTDELGEIILADDTSLPIKLPEEVEFDGVHSPLKTMKEFIEVKNSETNEILQRETDTFDTFMESSWYYARFCSSDNNKAMLDERANYWLPVDLYIGGIEHAILHLLYARFYHKLLRDEGLVKGDEPFKSLLTQGMVLKDGAKMSKSQGNTVDPEEMINNYGADTVRLFMMFTAPPEQSLEWSDTAINGSFRFLKKLWNTVELKNDQIKSIGSIKGNESFNELQTDLRRKTHKTIAKVTDDIGRRYTFNTAIAAIMELFNHLNIFKMNSDLDKKVVRESIETILLLLSPIVPHICNRLWHEIGNENAIIYERWPVYQKDLTVDDVIEVVIQVNGKLRSRALISADKSKEEMKEIALSDSKIISFIDGKEIKKVIVVPKKLINIVI
ncbi:MAG: leucine--tRNA ligase, partial [Gammaproteobacteria bacterium]|nr:leucine--tRNA ligase [Gammaproteobacteria bacterium]